jgi:hemophore-related protein
MTRKVCSVRTALSALGAAAAAGVVMLSASPSALADDGPPPPPNCTAADLAGVMSGVSAATSAYLFTHPDVNAFFTGLNGQQRDQMRDRAQTYMDANPQVRDELRGIRQPAADFQNRCTG